MVFESASINEPFRAPAKNVEWYARRSLGRFQTPNFEEELPTSTRIDILSLSLSSNQKVVAE